MDRKAIRTAIKGLESIPKDGWFDSEFEVSGLKRLTAETASYVRLISEEICYDSSKLSQILAEEFIQSKQSDSFTTEIEKVIALGKKYLR